MCVNGRCLKDEQHYNHSIKIKATINVGKLKRVRERVQGKRHTNCGCMCDKCGKKLKKF